MDDDDVRVLADELIERGDPYGELISLLLARDALAADVLPARHRVIESRIAAHLDRHHDTLYGALAPHVQRVSRPDLRTPALHVDSWARGFVEVTLQPAPALDLAEATRGLRRAPIGRFVRRIAFRHGADAAVVRVLVEARFPALRELVLGWSGNPRNDDPFVETLAPLLPALEVLELRSRSRYVPFAAPRLKKLAMWLPTNGPAIRFESQLDAIEHLELAEFEASRGLLRRYPTLRHARLSGSFEPGWLEELVTSDLGRLETITLFGAFHEPDLEVLVQNAPRLAQLAQLAISTPWGAISTAAREAARARLPPHITVG